MINYIDYERICSLGEGDYSVSMSNKIIKLSEEAGELSQSYLKYAGSDNASASAEGSPLEVIEEAGDVINVSLDIINSIVRKHPELEDSVKDLFDRKLDKWESKQVKYREL